jgi:hypothetical protein
MTLLGEDDEPQRRLDFVIVGLPRSGTAWATNWLTHGDVKVFHDPLNHMHYTDIDDLAGGAPVTGVACTGLYHFHSWLNDHPCRKVVLHRPVHEVKESLARIGLQSRLLRPESLHKVKGMHLKWTDLWERPQLVWKYLFDGPFDVYRHKRMSYFNIQVQVSRRNTDAKLMNRMLTEIAQHDKPSRTAQKEEAGGPGHNKALGGDAGEGEGG